MTEENIKQESPFQSEVTSEIGAVAEVGVSSAYDQRNLGFASNFYGLPNDFTTVSADNHIPCLSNIEEAGGYSPAVRDTTSGTGIILRNRQSSNHSTLHSGVAQGTAPRRIRLQKKFQLGPVQCGLPKESTDSKIIHEGELTQVRVHSRSSLPIWMPAF